MTDAEGVVPAGGVRQSAEPNAVARLGSVRKVYGRRANEVVALDGITIGFERTTFTAVMGPSGCGKTTLLNVAAGLGRPTSGSVVLEGADLSVMNEAALTTFRRERSRSAAWYGLIQTV